MAVATPELADQARRMLYDYTRKLGFLPWQSRANGEKSGAQRGCKETGSFQRGLNVEIGMKQSKQCPGSVMIDEKYLKQLRVAGLYISSPYSPTHGWSDGVRDGKPITTPGNSIPGYNAGYIVVGPKAKEPSEISREQKPKGWTL